MDLPATQIPIAGVHLYPIAGTFLLIFATVFAWTKIFV